MTVTILGKGDTTNIIVKVKTRRTLALVVKTYKNVTENNPEPEMLTALAKAGFNNAPKLVGQMAYTGFKKPLVLAILQRFEESEGDGRQPFAKSLRDELRNFSSESPSSLIHARKLGEIIASMHHALRQSTAEGFQASLITENDIEAWETRTKEALTDFLKEASSKGGGFDPFISHLVKMTSSTVEKIHTRLSEMETIIGMVKIRTHQDLHLAQLLLKHNGEKGFLIIDFEGDPQRTEKARREKESPLRDLGTLSRSFSYLRYYVLSELLEEAGIAKSYEAIASHDLAPHIKLAATSPRASYLENWFSNSMEWETKVRKTMIQAYLTKADRLGDKLLSTKAGYDEVDSMIRLWEIEKVILEANYELHHRPQNLIIPLAGLLTLCL
jgi:predicted trehalose synthase